MPTSCFFRTVINISEQFQHTSIQHNIFKVPPAIYVDLNYKSTPKVSIY